MQCKAADQALGCRWCAFQHVVGQLRPLRHQNSISAHGISHQANPLGRNGSYCWVVASFRHIRQSVQHKMNIARSINGDGFGDILVLVGRVSMVDTGHCVALAGQVFSQMRQQEPITRIAVRNDHQREGITIACWSCVRLRLAMQGDRRDSIPQHGLYGCW